MASVISNATLEQVKAIETEWNAHLQAEYDAVNARYPDINLNDMDGRIISLLPDVADVHPVTGDAIILGWNTRTLSNVRATKEIINAIKKKSIMSPTTDDEIFFGCQIIWDRDGFVSGAVHSSMPIEDFFIDPGDASTRQKGLRTLIAEERVSIHIDDNNVKTLVVAEE